MDFKMKNAPYNDVPDIGGIPFSQKVKEDCARFEAEIKSREVAFKKAGRLGERLNAIIQRQGATDGHFIKINRQTLCELLAFLDHLSKL